MTKKPSLNKKKLVNDICGKHPTVAGADMERAVNIIFDEMATALVCGDRVEIRGFGSLVVKRRAKGKVRNPKSGEIIEADDRGSLYFRASRELIKTLNFTSVNDN
ncbi:MAG: integration host factor beta-subunit [Candidatus Midichloriaceae bacterium]|jgi:integration host factor subunit beta|nr:integration host factor beta-subunit [Candidatus Midichloriaceae bacterium]